MAFMTRMECYIMSAYDSARGREDLWAVGSLDPCTLLPSGFDMSPLSELA